MTGVVQGVGFRPSVYRMATSMSLSGFVSNHGGDVVIEVQGPSEDLDRFTELLANSPPPASSIDSVHTRRIEPKSESGFEIRDSLEKRPRLSGLSPDLAPCGECLQELEDPGARRHRYGLLSCSDCGPRYTIFTSLPYDRERTTMEPYPLCGECGSEYLDPADRRYHAEPLACPQCGPPVVLVDSEGEDIAGDPYAGAGGILQRGGVVAVKGVGGYLLAADAGNGAAVGRLREGKQRPSKPFAVMARNLDAADELAVLDEASTKALRSTASPIVLAPLRDNPGISEQVCPGMSDVGIMLPSTPIHHLLLAQSPPYLVMTSGNPGSEPIIGDDRQALESLDADAFLRHDREIENPIDDSVVKPPVIIRRARGYVPRPIKAPFSSSQAVLGMGGELKATFAFMVDDLILPGRPVGDLQSVAVEEVWLAELRQLLKRYDIEPTIVAHDLHPAYRSTLLAGCLAGGGTTVPVQHHHAHLAAVMLEYGLAPDCSAVGIILDGTGYGTDGRVWGGEVLVGSYRSFSRAAHLLEVPMPGGEIAAREPCRMADSLRIAAELEPVEERFANLARSRRLSPLTTSAGRLLDGAAHICGIAPDRMTYEAQSAMLFEAAAHRAGDIDDPYPFDIADGIIDSRPMIRALAEDDSAPEVKAARFHAALADAFSSAAIAAAEPENLPVVVGGGCFANRILLGRIGARLAEAGVELLIPTELPVGDGAVSAGQAAVAAAMGLD